MFQGIAITTFLLTLVGVIAHWRAYPTTDECHEKGGAIRGIVHVLCLLLIEQRLSLLGALKKLCYLVAAFCFVVLGFTGFYPLLARGEHISGYLMMIHATLAPVFAICLAILAVTWASRFRFEKADCPWVQQILRRFTRLQLSAAQGSCKASAIVWKATFWLIVALALPLILSIALSMLPLLGTDGQELLLAVHRWTAVVFAVIVIVHTYTAIRIRLAT